VIRQCDSYDVNDNQTASDRKNMSRGPTQSDSPDTVTRIVAVGDLHPGQEERPEPLFEHCLDLLDAGDITFGQVEVTFSNKGQLQRFPSATTYIRVPPEYASALSNVGFNVVSCASNHAMDWGADAMLDSIANIEASGISVIGAGAEEARARAPAVFHHAGNRIVILAYTSVAPPDCHASEGVPGVAPMRARTFYEAIDYQPGTPPLVVTVPNQDDLTQLEQDIRVAKDIADVVIVSLHWGVHHLAKVVADYQPVVAHAAIDSGADLIVGHHPHVLKAIEIYRDRPIFYSIGNFAFDGVGHTITTDAKRHARKRHYQTLRAYGGVVKSSGEPGAPPPRHPPDSKKTVIVKVSVSQGRITRVSLVPTMINGVNQPVPQLPDDEGFEEILSYLEWLSEGFPHRFMVDNDEVLVSI
jgi:Bacterial capsule synthesis protein PGA_cap